MAPPTPLGATTRFKPQRYLIHNAYWTLAESEPGLEGKTEFGLTWNPKATGNACGFPQSRGHQQWMVLPNEVKELLIKHHGDLKSADGYDKKAW